MSFENDNHSGNLFRSLFPVKNYRIYSTYTNLRGNSSKNKDDFQVEVMEKEFALVQTPFPEDLERIGNQLGLEKDVRLDLLLL